MNFHSASLLTTLRNYFFHEWRRKTTQTPPGKQLFSAIRKEQNRDLTLTYVLAAQIFPLGCLLTSFSKPKTLFNQSENEHTAQWCKGHQRHLKTEQVCRAEKTSWTTVSLGNRRSTKALEIIAANERATFANCLNELFDKQRGEIEWPNGCYHFHNKFWEIFWRIFWRMELYPSGPVCDRFRDIQGVLNVWDVFFLSIKLKAQLPPPHTFNRHAWNNKSLSQSKSLRCRFVRVSSSNVSLTLTAQPWRNPHGFTFSQCKPRTSPSSYRISTSHAISIEMHILIANSPSILSLLNESRCRANAVEGGVNAVCFETFWKF